MTEGKRQNLYVYSGGFLTQSRVRRIVSLAGYDIKLGKPGPDDLVGVWGQSPKAPRGEAVAAHTESPIVRIEDAFLRSVLTGRDGDPAIGLHIDRSGVHFDPSVPSDLEQILLENPLDDTVLLNRARAGIDAMKAAHLSKYNAFDPATPAPEPGYVVVIDQTRKDASVKASGADMNTFREMLFFAQTEHPGARIIIKTHPETQAGHRGGYFDASNEDERTTLFDAPISPWVLFEGAIAVYAVTSQMGFEAILAGHKPVVFGQPFYMGWGLTDDRKPLARRQRNLTRAQLFAAAMILYPVWYDPYHDRQCSFEEVVATMAALTRAWREDHKGWVAAGMRPWKWRIMNQMFGQYERTLFRSEANAPATAKAKDRPMMAWASRRHDLPEDDEKPILIEDGFLRSRGLGADLVVPLSLVCDDVGIYYDATGPSRLEHLINASEGLTDGARARANNLIARVTDARLSKYNVGQGDVFPDLPKGRRILVPGQVEDDASIRMGTTDISDNRSLLQAARDANPAAVIIYKPHPDVEALLRKGHVADADQIADVVLRDADPIAALDHVDEVWTMTSLLGFEALLRGKKVTCLGNPFYAGWGLTDDRAMPIARRTARPDLAALVHATLIAYPRYFDPVTRMPCPVEVVVDRLENGDLPAPSWANRALARAHRRRTKWRLKQG